MSITRHRPPHSEYIIKELVKMEAFEEALQYCENNEEFYRKKLDEVMDLWGHVAQTKLITQQEQKEAS